jgi:Kef-type K+ transport system membrane component KefB
LVPFFLVGIGLHFDVSAFTGGRTLGLAGALLVAAVLSKFLACGAGALSAGRTDAIRVGIGMVPRGEVGMVVAQIGLNLGVIGHGIYGIIVFMSVATTLIAPPLLKLAFGSPTEVEQEIVRQG